MSEVRVGVRDLKARLSECLRAVKSGQTVIITEHGLRSYDATHLASLLLWQEALGQPVTLAAFDSQLLTAARAEGLSTLS